MNKASTFIAIAAFIVGGLLGVIAMDKIRTCPSEVPNERLDSLSAAVQYHSMMEDSAWAQALRFAAQRDSALNSPMVITKTEYRSHVQRTIDGAGLNAVLDTLGASAGEWVIAR